MWSGFATRHMMLVYTKTRQRQKEKRNIFCKEKRKSLDLVSLIFIIHHMLICSHIPISGLSVMQGVNNGLSDRTIPETIEYIIRDGLNWNLTLDESKKYEHFFSEACKVLWIGESSDWDDHISRFISIEQYPRLIKLYLSICINNKSKISTLLQRQYQETFIHWDTRISIWENSFYEVSQNMHGDVSLRQYPRIDKIQSELFQKDWLDISDIKWDHISMYQHTMSFVSALLKSFRLAWWDNSKLAKILLELDWEFVKVVHAADSGTDDGAIDRWLYAANSKQNQSEKYLGIYIHSHHSSWYQSAFNKDSKELEFWEVKRNEDASFEEKKVMSISSEDIHLLLKDVCILSGRDWYWPRILISKFIENS